MTEQTNRIQRNTNLIKGFMALVIIMQVVQFYQINVLDFGAIAGAIGVLSLLRGLLLSPQVLVTPVRRWLNTKFIFSKASYRYFMSAFVLIIVSAF